MYHKIDGGNFFDKILLEIPAEDSAAIGEKMLLYWLIRELKPETVIETGTHRGLSSLYMAHALYDNQKGRLHTADPFEWGQRGNFNKFLELDKYITFYQTPGSEMLKLIDNIDFAFIDGFHGVKDVVPEIKQLLLKLTAGSIVVFHDCWYGDTGGVNEAIEEAGLVSVWLPTTNAIRIYQHPIIKPRGRDNLYKK